MVKSLQNHAATLKCAANANPAATFAWYKDDRPISSGFSSEHDASTLTLIPNTTGDFGLYACKVTNSQGTTWHNVTLEQLRKLKKKVTLTLGLKELILTSIKKKENTHSFTKVENFFRFSGRTSIKGELLDHHDQLLDYHHWDIHVCIYIYIYIYITNCRQYCFGLLGLISAVLMLRCIYIYIYPFSETFSSRYICI